MFSPKFAATLTFLRDDVEPRMRTAASVAWEAAVEMSLLVRTLSLLDRECCSGVYCSSTGCCSCTYVLLLLLLLLRALQQHEEVVFHRKPSDRVVGGAGLCE